MIKKIIHLADIHIRTYKLHEEYNNAFDKMYVEVVKLIEDFDRDEVRIVIVGDLVHQKIIVSNEQMVLCANLLSRLAKLAPLIVVAGNHDLLETNLSRIDSITPIIDMLDNKDISYLKESECYVDDNIVWCNYSIFEGNKRPDIEKSRTTLGDDKTYVGLYHAPLQGATTSIGYEFDGEHTSTSIFVGTDMVLLGDIHKRQSFEIVDGDKTIIAAYPSSLIQQNFGESVSGHGFLCWDVEARNFEEVDLDIDYGLYTFKVDSIDDIETGSEKLLNP